MDARKTNPKERDRLKSASRYKRHVGYVYVLIVLGIWYCVYRTMIVEGAHWREIAKTLRPPKEKPISPTRGNIYSSDGKLLAISPPFYRLYINFSAEGISLLEQKGMLNERLDLLAGFISSSLTRTHFSKEQLLARWQKAYKEKDKRCDILGYNITFHEYELITNSPAMFVKINGKQFRSSLYRSLFSEKETPRMHPYGDLAAATIGKVFGTVDKDGLSVGSYGLEKACDSLLKGRPGKALHQYIGGRNTTRILEEPHTGSNLYTTLSMDIQEEVERILRQQLIHLKAQRGTAILMEASTGKIVAMANLTRKDSTTYQESYPMAFMDMMEPGSTFKAATTMALLDDGFITPESTIDVGNGHWYYGGAHIEDGRTSRGVLTYAKAIAISSNIAMAKTTVNCYGENPQRYIDKIKSFGFGEDLQLELKMDGSQKARIKNFNAKGWSKLSLPWIAHGYETQMPPIMILAFYNAIANGGTLYRPSLIEKVVDAQGDEVYEGTPLVIRDSICKPSTILALHQILRGVVTEGTGKIVNSPYVAICGKSGTAQIAQGATGYRGAGKTHSVTFVGFFPYEAPKYSCLVNIVSPRKDFYPSGGTMAGPVLRDIAEYIALSSRTYNIDTIAPLTDVHKEEHKRVPIPVYKPATVPNVIGMTASDATYCMMRCGLKVRLRGNGVVIEQSQAAGNAIKKEKTIILTLSKREVHSLAERKGEANEEKN